MARQKALGVGVGVGVGLGSAWALEGLADASTVQQTHPPYSFDLTLPVMYADNFSKHIKPKVDEKTNMPIRSGTCFVSSGRLTIN